MTLPPSSIFSTAPSEAFPCTANARRPSEQLERVHPYVWRDGSYLNGKPLKILSPQRQGDTHESKDGE